MIVEDVIDARILVELSQRLSFAAVAQALAMPPATVSRRLMRMEERAGLRLFERTTRSVAPTDAGVLAVSHAARMLAEADAIDLSFAAMRETATGTVRITTPTIFGQALLGPVMSAFIAAHPHCDLAVDLSDARSNLVEDGHDAAVRVGPPFDDTLVARPLGMVHAGLYQRAGLVAPTIDTLAEQPMGLLHRGGRSDPTLALISETGEERLLHVSARIVCMNPWLLRHAALTSDLTVVLPQIVAAPDVAQGSLVRALPAWFARRVPVHLVYPSQRLMRPAVRAFIETASATIRDLLGPAGNPPPTPR